MSVAGRADIGIVGAGIVGLALAVAFSERGLRVVVFDREERPVGASIRNFGLAWPMGQQRGPRWQRALRSRARWLELGKKAGFHVAENGSLHLAETELELQVLREFLELQAPPDFQGELLNGPDLAKKSPAARADRLAGGLWSPHELTVDGRQALPAIWRWLAAERGVTVLPDAAVSRVTMPAVHTAKGVWEVDRLFVCTGADLRLLYPDVFRAAGVTNCKLQMWRTAPQAGGWRLGPSLCGGLTLLHYPAFAACPSLAVLRAGFERTHLEYLEHGIHVLVSQNSLGEVVLGDTHHYGLTHDPFLHDRLDRLVQEYLNTFARVPEVTASERWFGLYAKLPGATELIAHPEPGVTIVNALGGNGMTLSFGLAQEIADDTQG